MLYLISGASRAGKTMIAKTVAARKGISYFSLDWLVMGFTNGIPTYGIHDLLFPDEIAERSWSFLKAMFESMIWGEEDYIIEGEAILPELIIELVNNHAGKLSICFVGYTDVDVHQKFKEIKRYSTGKKDWLNDKSDEYIIDHVNNMVTHSKRIKQSCRENDLAYFDTSSNFLDGINRAMDFLLK
jgi:2-phosphoglycerate kinase